MSYYTDCNLTFIFDAVVTDMLMTPVYTDNMNQLLMFA